MRINSNMKEFTENKESIRLSPSSINTFLKCPREFFLSYIKRLPRKTTHHMLKGTIIHEVLENFYDKYDKAPETKMDTLFNESFEKFKEEWDALGLSKEVSRKEKDDCKRILMLQAILLQVKMDVLVEGGKAKSKSEAFKQIAPRFKEMWVEDEELNVCGYIDRVDIGYNGEINITDYKTSKRHGTGMPEDYKLQCGIYAVLYFRETGKMPTLVSIDYLRYGSEPGILVTPSLLQYTLQKIQFVRDNTWGRELEDYPMNEQHLCKWCSYVGMCSSMEKIEEAERMKAMLKAVEEADKKEEEGKSNTDSPEL